MNVAHILKHAGWEGDISHGNVSKYPTSELRKKFYIENKLNFVLAAQIIIVVRYI